MRNRVTKGLLLLLSWTAMALAYPFIRFNGNWNNNDFSHIIPKLAKVLEQREFINGAASGNSILYQITVAIWYEFTAIELPDLLLYAIPFAMTIVVYLAVFYFFRRFTTNARATIALSLVAVIPIFAAMHASGKHSVFSYSLFYLSLATSIEQGQRKRALHFLFIFALLFFHIYISALLLAFLLGHHLLSRGGLVSLRDQKTNNQTASAAILAGGIAWVSYLINTPSMSFSAFIYGTLPPYPDGASGSLPTGATKAGSGFAQFMDVLGQRWEPWWVWFLLSIPLFLLTAVGFGTWLRSIASIVRTGDGTYDNPLIFATIAGLIGLFVAGASVAGFSATNLIFRFLVYFLPIVAILIVIRPVGEWMTSSQLGVVLLVCFLIIGAIVAPVKTSREPALQEERLGMYSENEVTALRWFITHSDADLTVSNTLVADAIYYTEFGIYEDGSKTPPTLKVSPWQLLRGEPPPTESTIYSNGEWTISPLRNWTEPNHS